MGHSTVVKSLHGQLEPALFFLNSKIPRERGDTNARVHTSRNSETGKASCPSVALPYVTPAGSTMSWAHTAILVWAEMLLRPSKSLGCRDRRDRTSPWTSQQVYGESRSLFIMRVPASLTAFGTGRGILPGTSAWMILFLKVLGGRVKNNIYFLEEGAYAKCSTL